MHREFIFEQAPAASCHASTLAEVEPDVFVAAWFGGAREGAPDVAIWGARRTAEGWSEPEIVADEPGVACWNPVLFSAGVRRLILFYKAGPSPQTWSGLYRTSIDGGRSYGTPTLMPAGLLGPVKNKPIVLSRGRIVAGSSVESHRSWAAWVELSDDGGASWRRRGPIVFPGESRGVIQPTLFEASDGTLRMLLRSTSRIGHVCASSSTDDGESWSPAEVTSLPNPNSGIDCVRLADGRVVLCHNPVSRGRTPLALSVSEDDGATWRHGPVLESGPGEYSYPAVIQGADGGVHLSYTWRRTRIRHVVLQPDEL